MNPLGGCSSSPYAAASSAASDMSTVRVRWSTRAAAPCVPERQGDVRHNSVRLPLRNSGGGAWGLQRVPFASAGAAGGPARAQRTIPGPIRNSHRSPSRVADPRRRCHTGRRSGAEVAIRDLRNRYPGYKFEIRMEFCRTPHLNSYLITVKLQNLLIALISPLQGRCG